MIRISQGCYHLAKAGKLTTDFVKVLVIFQVKGYIAHDFGSCYFEMINDDS